jgi:2-oxo-4-hydroxy-4-carboxy-5-ureidoimidazoline decarboxylase
VNLASFNAASKQEAVAAMLACCASRRFAAYASQAAALAAVETVFASLTWPDVLEAMGAHPRIGARVSGQSAAEQSGVTGDSRAALLAGNLAYEERFGHVFLICATGLSGAEMLTALNRRLNNDETSERVAATTELRKITLLRVSKALAQ